MDMMLEIVKLIIDKEIDRGVDYVIDKKVVDHKFQQITIQLQKIIEREPDELNRERLHEFLIGKCESLFWGKDDLDDEEIIREIKIKYGTILPNDTKKLLLEGMRLIHEKINEILSPEQRMFMLYNREIKALLIELQRMLEGFAKQIENKELDFGSREETGTEIGRKNTRGDWVKYTKLWEKDLFNEDINARKLSDIFVKTNYSFIEIRKEVNESRKRNLKTTGKSINGYVINEIPNYQDNHLPSEYVLNHFNNLINDCVNIDDFLNKQVKSDKKIALIFGLPGAGKSSIVAYMAGDYFKTEKNSIFVLLSKINYDGNLLEAICKYLAIGIEELENKYLILDGLDEVAEVSNAEVMLVNFIDAINRKYHNINVFITLRDNYIDIRSAKYVQYYSYCNVAQIEYFGKIQMVDFHQKYIGERMDAGRLELLSKDREVFGIPLLLYIIYSLKIDVTDKDDKYKLYEKIFSISGGIYDKCNDGKGGYSKEMEFSVEEKEGFHSISQIIAYQIYREKTLEIDLQIITDAIKEKDYPVRSQRCYLYNNYFEKTDQGIKFIHKSFYEFFLAEYCGNMLFELCRGRMDKQKAYTILSNFLAYNKIDDEVFHHLLNKMKQCDLEMVDFLEDYLNEVCRRGGCYFVTEKNNSILRLEAYLFYNLLKIIDVVASMIGIKVIASFEEELWDELANIEQIGFLQAHLLDEIEFIDLYQYADSFSIFEEDRMKTSMIDTRHHLWMNTIFSDLVFQNSDLSEMYFLGSKMMKCRFEGTQLHDCDFRYNQLSSIKFVNGSLKDSDFSGSTFDDVLFRGVDLFGVKLENCAFQKVTFDSENIKYVEHYFVEKQDNVYVFIRNTKETISYTMYKQNYSGSVV